MMEVPNNEIAMPLQICSNEPINIRGVSDASASICLPDTSMQLNVSSDVNYVTLHPALRYPEIQNLRVEVAGQVLSQGGNVGADQLADTTATLTDRCLNQRV